MSSSKNEIEVTVYKSSRKDETYVFLPVDTAVSELPDELTTVLGKPEQVMTLKLTPERKMARGTAAEIMKSIDEQGFHLQLPEKQHINENPLAYMNDRFLDKNL